MPLSYLPIFGESCTGIAPFENSKYFSSVASDFSFFLVDINGFIIHTRSGHRIGTAEVESALVSHPQCAEAAVVGVEHEVPF